MSKKQNKAKGTRRRNAHDIEKELLKTRYPLECESLPLASLNSEEQRVVSKCINGEEFNDADFSLLKQTLQKYRKVINEYQPDETVNDIEQTIKIIKTEKDLLDLLDAPERRKLLVHLPIGDQTVSLDFDVKPLDDSRVVESLQAQLDLFRDFTQSEKETYTRAQAGQTLTPEEASVVKNMETKINEMVSEHNEEICNKLLANQLRLPESSQSYEDRLYFWKRFPFTAKFSIFTKVQYMLGLTEQNNEELFPTRE